MGKQRIFSFRIKENNGCWEWCSKRDRAGYGQLTRERKNLMAHKLSYQIFVGPIKKGLYVCHKCDNPPCIRPDHLFLGTQKQNMKDCIEKGRFKIGGNKYSAAANQRLTEKQVKEIRRKYPSGNYTQLELAKFYGVTQTCISDILVFKTWKHL
jgi:hypothetical protein